MVDIVRRRLFGRATQLTAGAAAILALPSLGQTSAPASDFDAAVAKLRAANLTQTPKMQQAMLRVVSSFADYASPRG